MKKHDIFVDWDKYAIQYDDITMNGSNPAYLELVRKVNYFFGHGLIENNSLVVDLGGGTGNFTIPLAKEYPNSKFVIVDLSEKMLEIANEKAHRLGLKNIETMLEDVEQISKITKTYSRPINHAIMIHALYTTGSKYSEKPRNILKNIWEELENSNSCFFISDINRNLNTNNWIPYCLWNSFITFKKNVPQTIKYFIKNDQSKLANRFIDMKQNKGEYLICSLDELVDMLKDAGFSKIYEKSDEYYRGRDNLVIAGK